MTRIKGKTASATVQDILLSSPDGLREVIRAPMHLRQTLRLLWTLAWAAQPKPNSP